MNTRPRARPFFEGQEAPEQLALFLSPPRDQDPGGPIPRGTPPTSSTERTTVTSSDPARITRPGVVQRTRLTEPVRLYLWPVVLGLLVAFVALGWTTQEWTDWALALLTPAAATAGLTEAARASVYSPRAHVADVIRAAGNGGWSRAADVLDAGSAVSPGRPVFRVPS